MLTVTKPVLLLWVMGIVMPSLMWAQQTVSAPEKQQYNFTEVWVWEYYNNGISSEMAVYREPNLNYWLLTHEAFGQTDEMTRWFLLKPDGEVLQAYVDGEQDTALKFVTHRLRPRKKSTLPSYLKATGKTMKFGSDRLGFPLLTGKQYAVTYAKSTGTSMMYLAPYGGDFSVLYYFNDLNIDAKLPINFLRDIPFNYVLLREQTIFGDSKIHYSFKYISHTEYYIDLP